MFFEPIAIWLAFLRLAAWVLSVVGTTSCGRVETRTSGDDDALLDDDWIPGDTLELASVSVFGDDDGDIVIVVGVVNVVGKEAKPESTFSG